MSRASLRERIVALVLAVLCKPFRFAVVTQYDCPPGDLAMFSADDPLAPDGPLLHECYLRKASDVLSARQRQVTFGSKYGWCRLYLLLSQTRALVLASVILALGVVIGFGGAVWLVA